MSNDASHCAKCGTPLPPNWPKGLCSRCALEGALELSNAESQVLQPDTPQGPARTIAVSESDFVLDRTGTMIGRYKLLQKIGEGGFGVVYMAEQQEPVQRKVALKIIKAGMDTREVIARFEAERQAIALMDHPNIARVLDAGATDAGRPYFVMELVRGIPITDFCDQGHLPATERLKLFMTVCHAVQHAHQKGVIHRDIKPSNVLVTLHDGAPVPKVIDFGVAKALGQKLTEKTLFTAFHHMIGTPAYMSPEQAALSGLDIDTRADIYSLGVLLYELLTGVTPFDAETLRKAALDEIRRMIRETEPLKPSTRLTQELVAADVRRLKSSASGKPPSEEEIRASSRRLLQIKELISLLRGDLDWIVMKCLEKDRARRYETANALVTDIQRHLQNETVVARPPSNLYRFQKMVRRNKLAFGAASAVATSLVIGLTLSTWLFLKEKQARGQAESAGQSEATQRAKAEAAEKTAQAEAKRAKDAENEVKMTLSASDFRQAVRLIAEGEGTDALACLVRSIEGNPRNDAASTRLTTLLTYHSWMLPTLILNHTNAVLSAQFSPDGKRIITASYDHTARLWDAQSGQSLTEPMKHNREVATAHFSPDGKRIVTASWDHTARVWDAQSGQPLTEPLKHAEFVVSAQFSPDGKWIVTASWDHTARVWDAQNGQSLTEPLKHNGEVRSAQFSPDGRRIVTASFDQTARVWDAHSSQPLTEPLKHKGWVTSAQFSPDGKRIVTASWDHTARMWDARSGKPLKEPLKHDGAVALAQFSPDGKWIVTVSRDRTARVWDADNGQPLTEPLKHSSEVISAQFSPDGRRIVTASFDQTARVWDAQSSQPLTEPLKHNGWVSSAEFSPDGMRIVTASLDQAARVWDVQSGQPVTEPLQHNSQVSSAQFSPDGRRIITASDDQTSRVWDAQSGQPLTEPLRHNGSVTSAQFSPDGKRIVTASFDQTARVWDAQSGQPLTEPLKHNSQVNSAQFSPDGKRIVTASLDHTARVWDGQNGQPLTEPLKHNGPVNSAQFSPDGKRIVTACLVDHTARVWDVQSGQPLTEPLRHNSKVISAQFSPDGKQVFTASEGHTAQVWDAQNGQPLTEPLEHNVGAVSAQFSPNGKQVVTASDDQTARVWDVQSGQPLTEPLKHNGEVRSAQFSPDGKRIVTASVDHSARVWDVQSGQPLTEPLKHNGTVTSAQFSPDGKRIVTASVDHSARVWDIAPANPGCPDWLLQLAEAISGRVLNKQGVLEKTKLNSIETIKQIRERLSHDSRDDDWVVWGRWFLAEPSARTVSPFSKATVLQYIENAVTGGDFASLDEAERLAVGNLELLQRISQARRTLKQIEQADALQKQAEKLHQEGKLAGAETKLREAVALTQMSWTNDPARWADSINKLMVTLQRYGKNREIEQFISDVVTPALANQPQNAGLLHGRADFFARRGRWLEAAADLSKLLELDAGDHWIWYQLAPLLVENGDVAGYRRHCQAMLARFGETSESTLARRITKACLLLPATGTNLTAVAKVADVDRAQSAAFMEMVKGLAEYRQGRFASAVEWSKKSLAKPAIDLRDAQACLVLAMAHHQLNQPTEARAALSRGREIAETKLPKLDSGDLGDSWHDWLAIQILLREAKALIESQSATEKK